MDPLTHLLATRTFIGRDRTTLLVGIAPDLAFYSTYPQWVLRRGRVRPRPLVMDLSRPFL